MVQPSSFIYFEVSDNNLFCHLLTRKIASFTQLMVFHLFTQHVKRWNVKLWQKMSPLHKTRKASLSFTYTYLRNFCSVHN